MMDTVAEKLAEALQEAGKRLDADPGRMQLEEYGKALGNLLAYISENAYIIEEEREIKLDRSKVAPYNRVEILRERLVSTDRISDDFIRELMDGQKERLEILKRYNGAGGLLINTDR